MKKMAFIFSLISVLSIAHAEPTKVNMNAIIKNNIVLDISGNDLAIDDVKICAHYSASRLSTPERDSLGVADNVCKLLGKNLENAVNLKAISSNYRERDEYSRCIYIDYQLNLTYMKSDTILTSVKCIKQ